MKKLVFVLSIVIAFTLSTKVMAQVPDDEDYVVFNAHLVHVLDIVVDPAGAVQEITFDAAAEYTNGVDEANGIVPGYSDVSVEATVNWDMTIEAPDFLPGGGPTPGTGYIPIGNLGVWIEPIGSFAFGNQVNCPYAGVASAFGMTNAATPIITNNNGNAGDVNENNYRFHWLMGTMNGGMIQTTMFDQLQAGTFFTVGDFTTTATLTVSQVP